MVITQKTMLPEPCCTSTLKTVNSFFYTSPLTIRRLGILAGPLNLFFVFYKVTKAVEFKLPQGNRAFQLDFVIIHRDYFPVAFSATIVYVNFLSYFKWIGAENSDVVFFHFISRNTNKVITILA